MALFQLLLQIVYTELTEVFTLNLRSVPVLQKSLFVYPVNPKGFYGEPCMNNTEKAKSKISRRRCSDLFNLPDPQKFLSAIQYFSRVTTKTKMKLFGDIQ